MVRVKRHTVVSFAPSHGITPYHRVSRRIDDGKYILVLEVHVHLARDRVVLRHAGLTIEMQSLDDFVIITTSARRITSTTMPSETPTCSSR